MFARYCLLLFFLLPIWLFLALNDFMYGLVGCAVVAQIIASIMVMASMAVHAQVTEPPLPASSTRADEPVSLARIRSLDAPAGIRTPCE